MGKIVLLSFCALVFLTLVANTQADCGGCECNIFGCDCDRSIGERGCKTNDAKNACEGWFCGCDCDWKGYNCKHLVGSDYCDKHDKGIGGPNERTPTGFCTGCCGCTPGLCTCTFPDSRQCDCIRGRFVGCPETCYG